MIRYVSNLIICATAIAAATPAVANQFLIDMQGATPNRVAVYAQDIASSADPVSLASLGAPTTISQIDVTMVFEAVNKPHWTLYRFQFECPRYISKKGSSKRINIYSEDWVLPDQDTVRFRLEGGSTSPKDKVEINKLTPTEWQTSSSYVMKRLWRVACAGNTIIYAINGAAVKTKKGDMVDHPTLRKNMAKLGLDGAELVPEIGLTMTLLADWTWDNLWKDVPKAKIEQGPKMTPAELAAAKAKLVQMQQNVEDAKAEVMGNLTKMKVGLDFTQTAANYRGKRRPSRTEAILLPVWLGKTEQDVVAANGNPSVRQAGIARTLSYGQAFDNRVMWQGVATGATFSTGGYASCNVRYILIPDSAGEPRVADINVFGDTQGDTRGIKGVCADILNVPNG